MDFQEIDGELVTGLLLLLLIGIGPKIALVPFLEKTKGMDPHKTREIGTRMVTVAVVTALILFLAGALLMKLLHLTGGAVSIGGGIVLMLLALKMTVRPEHPPVEAEESTERAIDHHQLAVYPLAVPYLLNPVGMTVLIIASDEVNSIWGYLLVIALVLLVGAFDLLVFRNTDKIAKRMSPTKMIVSEIVFGILLTAVAIQLIAYGLIDYGIIAPAAH